jgi:polyferredoxin
VGGAGQHICTLGSVQRNLTLFYPFVFLILVIGSFILICLIIGRALCGWACPIGFFQDLISHGRNIGKLDKKEPSQKVHKKLAYVKYSILFLAIILAISIGLSALYNPLANAIYTERFPGSLIEVAPYCQFCPTPAIRHMTDFYIYDFNPQIFDPISMILVSLFMVFIIGAAIVPRFWCRYFCPMGAFSSFFNKVSLFTIQKTQSKCTRCGYCVNACPTRVTKIKDEDIDSRVTDTNCIFCLECIEACPEKALSFSCGSKIIYQGGKRNWWQRKNT